MHKRRALCGYSQGADFDRGGSELTRRVAGIFGEIPNDADAIKKLCNRLGIPASRWRLAMRPARAVMAVIANSQAWVIAATWWRHR